MNRKADLPEVQTRTCLACRHDRDVGRNLSLLAGIERVVQDLLAHHQRPILERVPGLILQLTQNSISRETLKATRVRFGSGMRKYSKPVAPKHLGVTGRLPVPRS